MTAYQKMINTAILVIGLSLAAGPVFAAGEDSSKLLPEGTVIKEGFKPGIGEPIGTISDIRGRAVVIHAKPAEGYPAAKGLSIYKNDTLVTFEDGHLGFTLNDGSFMSLVPRTRLQVNKSVYAPGQKTRSSFLDMGLGRARFVVRKLVDAKHSEFKVKTKTSVAGVRGSDFVIFASEAITEITALDDTLLEVVSLATPEAPPAMLNDFEQVRVSRGSSPAEVRRLDAQEVERLTREFQIQPPGPGGHVDLDVMQAPGAVQGGRDDAGEQGAPPPVFEVAGEDLVVPGPPAAPVGAGGPAIEPLGFQAPQAQQQMDQIREIQDQVVETKSEEVIVEEAVKLPDFPGLPDM